MNTLKIVHCANFSESKYGAVYYAIDRKISNGLIRNGHFVYDFSYREIAKNSTFFKSKKFGIKNTNNALLETLKNIEPDLLLLGHSELITIETLRKAKELYPQMKIAMWWVDWIYNLNNIQDRLDIIDHFFITTDPQELKQTNISEKLYEKCSYLPNICDSSIDTYKAFENKHYDFDALFIGRYDKERTLFINFLRSSFSHLKLGFFGLTKETILTGEHYLKTISSSKIGINYSRRNDISMYSSDRIIHLLANGTLVFSPRVPHLEKIIAEDEIIYFDNHEDFAYKLNYYLVHDEERIKISRKGWQKAHEFFNEKAISQIILNYVFPNNGALDDY